MVAKGKLHLECGGDGAVDSCWLWRLLAAERESSSATIAARRAYDAQTCLSVRSLVAEVVSESDGLEHQTRSTHSLRLLCRTRYALQILK